MLYYVGDLRLTRVNSTGQQISDAYCLQYVMQCTTQEFIY